MKARDEYFLSAPLIIAPSLLVLGAIYLGGYFGLCTGTFATTDGKCRAYRTEWEAQIFRPVALAEGAVTGGLVETEEDRSNAIMAPKNSTIFYLETSPKTQHPNR